MLKLGFSLVLLICSSSLWAQGQNISHLQKLISEIQKITFKKTKNPQQVAGRLEFTDVDVEVGGFPLELHNKNFQDGETFFNTNIYLKDSHIVFEGVNRIFVLSPEIAEDSFIKTVKEAEILNLSTHINERRFKINGEKIYFAANDMDVHLKEFYFFCNKTQTNDENDVTSIMNDCWTDGQIHQDYNRGAKSFDLGLNYKLISGENLKLYSEINNMVFNAQERVVSYHANVLETTLGETLKIVSGPLKLDCRHSRKREFKIDQFQHNCLDELNFHQDKINLRYTSIPTEEELNLDPHKTKTVYEVFMENSGVITTDKQLIADIDVFTVEEKSVAAGLYNLDLKCNKNKNFSKLDSVGIINTCLENATLVKRAEDDKTKASELSQAKIGYRLTENKTDIVDLILNIKKISSQTKKADFDLDLFKIEYMNSDAHYDILFPKVKMSCSRKPERDEKKIKIIDDCLEDNEIKTAASIIDEIDTDFKLYLRPIHFQTSAKGLGISLPAMQYYDISSHMNISGLRMDCQLNASGTNPNQLGQSVADIMQGCLKRGEFSIAKFVSFDNEKKTKATSQNIRSLFDKEINPLDYDDQTKWDLKDIKINFNAREFELSSWVKLPGILAGQEFVVTGAGDSEYRVGADGKEWLTLSIKKTSIQKLMFPINGDSNRTTYLIVQILKMLMPEERIVVNRKCENPETKKKFVCNQVNILMN